MLIVGCGCRGRSLSRRLLADGHAVRGTTREEPRAAAIAEVGAEPWVGDPYRLATLTRALEGVTVVCWMLASARGPADEVRALHDERLAAYLRELVDTAVRGFVYEAVGGLDPAVLARGRELTAAAGRTWQLPVVCIDADPQEPERWADEACAAIGSLLGRSASGA